MQHEERSTSSARSDSPTIHNGKSSTAVNRRLKRVTRACDACRRAKNRCTRDSEDGVCLNCETHQIACTYHMATKQRGPAKGFVSNRRTNVVEARLRTLEGLLGELKKSGSPPLASPQDQRATDQPSYPDTALHPHLENLLNTGSSIVPPLSNTCTGYATSQRHGPSAPLDDCLSASARFHPPPESTMDSLDVLLACASRLPASSYDPLSVRPPLQLHSHTHTLPISGAEFISTSTSLPSAHDYNSEQDTLLSESSWPSSVMSRPMLLPGDVSTGGQSIPSLSDVPPAGITRDFTPPDDVHQNMEGQLSLDENKETKFHGKSSGYFYIRQSGLHRNHFWSFPKPGTVALTQADPRGKLEEVIYAETKAYDFIPSTDTVEHLMDLYLSRVHPLLPLLCPSVFQRQYRSLLRSRPPGEKASISADIDRGRSSINYPSDKPCALALFFAILAVSSRYSVNDKHPRSVWEYWPAGDEYAKLANDILRLDHPTCRLSSIQANILLAYREIGCGLMVAGWHRVGSAVRMAQDMGLFKEVERWNLPVPDIFDWETKQARKRTWWCLLNMDRYVAMYLGRPLAVHEGDFDVEQPEEEVSDEYDAWSPVVISDPKLECQNWGNMHRPSRALSCLNRSSTLFSIAAQALRSFYSINAPKDKATRNRYLDELSAQLRAWRADLAAHLSLGTSGQAASPLPHVLTLHCQYYATVILVHRPFTASDIDAESRMDSHHQENKGLCMSAAVGITQALEQYRRTYGLVQCDPFLTYYAFTAGVIHICEGMHGHMNVEASTRQFETVLQLLQEMEITWGGAAKQRTLLASLLSQRAQATRHLKRSVRALSGYNTPHELDLASSQSGTLQLFGDTSSNSAESSTGPTVSSTFPTLPDQSGDDFQKMSAYFLHQLPGDETTNNRNQTGAFDYGDFISDIPFYGTLPSDTNDFRASIGMPVQSDLSDLFSDIFWDVEPGCN